MSVCVLSVCFGFKCVQGKSEGVNERKNQENTRERIYGFRILKGKIKRIGERGIKKRGKECGEKERANESERTWEGRD